MSDKKIKSKDKVKKPSNPKPCKGYAMGGAAKERKGEY